MYEILKALAKSNGWIFEYGRTDFQNLSDASEKKNVSHVFLDPVEIIKNRNDSQVVESITYSNSFMILYSSDIDEISYEERYQKYIKPIVLTEIGIVENELICEKKATIEQWKIVEVINMFDYNLDGILVTYIITIDV